MTKSAFEAWSSEAERIRDEALRDCERAPSAEERAKIASEAAEKLNRL